MNQERREQINEAREILEQVLVEELVAFDNLSESLQEADKGQEMDEAINNLQEALDILEAI